MTGTEKQAAFYRAYLIDDRSLIPLTFALATIVGLWLLVYLSAPPRRRLREWRNHPPSRDLCTRDHKDLAGPTLRSFQKREAVSPWPGPKPAMGPLYLTTANNINYLLIYNNVVC